MDPRSSRQSNAAAEFVVGPRPIRASGLRSRGDLLRLVPVAALRRAATWPSQTREGDTDAARLLVAGCPYRGCLRGALRLALSAPGSELQPAGPRAGASSWKKRWHGTVRIVRAEPNPRQYDQADAAGWYRRWRSCTRSFHGRCRGIEHKPAADPDSTVVFRSVRSNLATAARRLISMRLEAAHAHETRPAQMPLLKRSPRASAWRCPRRDRSPGIAPDPWRSTTWAAVRAWSAVGPVARLSDLTVAGSNRMTAVELTQAGARAG